MHKQLNMYMASSSRVVSLEHRFPRRPIAHIPFCTLMKKYANGMNGFRVGGCAQFSV